MWSDVWDVGIIVASNQFGRDVWSKSVTFRYIGDQLIIPIPTSINLDLLSNKYPLNAANRDNLTTRIWSAKYYILCNRVEYKDKCVTKYNITHSNVLTNIVNNETRCHFSSLRGISSINNLCIWSTYYYIIFDGE